MQVQRKTVSEGFSQPFDTAAEDAEFGGDYLAPGTPRDVHARGLQHRLTEAFSDTSEDQKLPIGQRVAVIVGATSVLWLLIGLAVYAVF